MLTKCPIRGFSLIELMVVVAIVAILTLVGLPSVADWLQNSRTRSMADSLQNGVRYAQTEAARLSRLTNLITTTNTWTVKYVPVTSGSDTLPVLLQTSPGGNVGSVTIAPDSPTHTVLQFNSLGRVSAASTETGTFQPLTGDAFFLVANPNGTRSLRIYVSGSGKVRMCDPGRSFSDTNPDGCP